MQGLGVWYTESMNKAKSGFTLVELLIVVVVIAILASITVVAYNGIRQRAYSAKAMSVVDAYTKVLSMYYIREGKYPDPGGNHMACIGQASNYPSGGGFSAGQCDNYTGAPISVDASLNNELSTYASPLPDGSLPAKNFTGTAEVRGVVYIYTADNVAAFQYFMDDKQTCGAGTPGYWSPGIIVCTVQLTS